MLYLKAGLQEIISIANGCNLHWVVGIQERYELTDTIILMDTLTICFSPCIFSPATVADRTPEPIALYVSFSDWLRRRGNRMSELYKEKMTPVLLFVVFSNAVGGMKILLKEALVSGLATGSSILLFSFVVLSEVLLLSSVELENVLSSYAAEGVEA